MAAWRPSAHINPGAHPTNHSPAALSTGHLAPGSYANVSSHSHPYGYRHCCRNINTNSHSHRYGAADINAHGDGHQYAYANTWRRWRLFLFWRSIQLP